MQSRSHSHVASSKIAYLLRLTITDHFQYLWDMLIKRRCPISSKNAATWPTQGPLSKIFATATNNNNIMAQQPFKIEFK